MRRSSHGCTRQVTTVYLFTDATSHSVPRPDRSVHFWVMTEQNVDGSHCVDCAQNLPGPDPNIWLTLFQISSKSVHFRRSYNRRYAWRPFFCPMRYFHNRLCHHLSGDSTYKYFSKTYYFELFRTCSFLSILTLHARLMFFLRDLVISASQDKSLWHWFSHQCHSKLLPYCRPLSDRGHGFQISRCVQTGRFPAFRSVVRTLALTFS